MAMTPTSSINFRLEQGDMKYVEPPTTLAAIQLINVVRVPALTTNQSINLATLFPALTAGSTVAISLRDVSGTPIPFTVSTAAADPGLPIRAGGFLAWAASSLPTIYVDNPHATLALELQIEVTGA